MSEYWRVKEKSWYDDNDYDCCDDDDDDENDDNDAHRFYERLLEIEPIYSVPCLSIISATL